MQQLDITKIKKAVWEIYKEIQPDIIMDLWKRWNAIRSTEEDRCLACIWKAFDILWEHLEKHQKYLWS